MSSEAGGTKRSDTATKSGMKKAYPSQTPEALHAYALAHRDAIRAQKKARRQEWTAE